MSDLPDPLPQTVFPYFFTIPTTTPSNLIFLHMFAVEQVGLGGVALWGQDSPSPPSLSTST